MPSLGVNPFEFLDEPFIAKIHGLLGGVYFVILACVILTQYLQRVGVTDGQMDGQRTQTCRLQL